MSAPPSAASDNGSACSMAGRLKPASTAAAIGLNRKKQNKESPQFFTAGLKWRVF